MIYRHLYYEHDEADICFHLCQLILILTFQRHKFFIYLCRLRNIFAIRLNSRIKNYSFVLNYANLEDKTHLHVWNAVLIDKKFHYVDCSWGASIVNGHGYCDSDSEDKEHFFFMSPKIVGDYC